MGTDIHARFQRKTNTGTWEAVDTNYQEDRHYLLFAWLGDVRNGYGFAGIPTHKPITALSSSRGFPPDFILEEDDWLGDHSFSWLSIDEILENYEKLPKILKTGVLTKEGFIKWDKKSEPERYSGGVSGPGVSVIDYKVLKYATNSSYTHIRTYWWKDLKEEFSYFITEIRRLKSLYGEIRMVFGFDS